MKLSDINIRDPFVLTHNGKYYMYGTRGKFTWGGGESSDYGFDVYVSDDLEHWSSPIPVFEYYNGFWGKKDFWAPEVHFYNGKFYMLATFKGEAGCRGTAILVSDTPDGKFKELSNGAITPADWECLDGTLYIEDGVPYMIFCHEWTQIKNGTVCAIRLSSDLKRAEGAPVLLWSAGDASWRWDLRDNGSYVTDGPFHIKNAEGLVFMWSSFYKGEYCEAIARSDNGKISGKWSVDDKLLYERDGGHGMVFTDLKGDLRFIYHSPNNTPDERPCVRKISIDLFNK